MPAAPAPPDDLVPASATEDDVAFLGSVYPLLDFKAYKAQTGQTHESEMGMAAIDLHNQICIIHRAYPTGDAAKDTLGGIRWISNYSTFTTNAEQHCS